MFHKIYILNDRLPYHSFISYWTVTNALKWRKSTPVLLKKGKKLGLINKLFMQCHKYNSRKWISLFTILLY